VALEIGHASVEAGQVGAGAESAVACARQHNDADLLLVLAPAKRRGQVAEHHGGQGIALLGPVEGDRGDVAFDREQNLL